MAFATLRRIFYPAASPKPAEAEPPMPSVATTAHSAAEPVSSAPSSPTTDAARSSGASAAEPSASSTTTAESGVPEEVRELRGVCAELDEAVTRFLEEEVEDEVLKRVQGRVRESMAVIAEALRRYTPDELALSYNGGKDCLVLLVLLLATLNRHPPNPFPRTLQCIYIVPPHPFPEVDAFVAHTSNTYSLTLTRSPLPMRAALSAYLDSNPSLRAVFVGTRRTDPHGSRLAPFDETDGDWPRFMRVHPVLEWHYVDIWIFIRKLGIEYCGLYDRGYTSLGGTTDTLPNPALKANGHFRPAYELVSDGEERLGRE
ncbi:hypothetical protein VUR80DRAFT_3887 [Thermomyces stellatus]